MKQYCFAFVITSRCLITTQSHSSRQREWLYLLRHQKLKQHRLTHVPNYKLLTGKKKFFLPQESWTTPTAQYSRKGPVVDTWCDLSQWICRCCHCLIPKPNDWQMIKVPASLSAGNFLSFATSSSHCSQNKPGLGYLLTRFFHSADPSFLPKFKIIHNHNNKQFTIQTHPPSPPPRPDRTSPPSASFESESSFAPAASSSRSFSAALTESLTARRLGSAATVRRGRLFSWWKAMVLLVE